MSTYNVKILTQEKVYFETEDAVSMSAPGEMGYLGILANHAPLVTPLAKGNVTVNLKSGETKQFLIDRGFLEVHKNQALVLTNSLHEEKNS